MASWKQIAQTASKQNLHSAWQLKIYEYTADTVTNTTVKLAEGDLILRRGNKSAKDKTGGFSITDISFKMLDSNNYLFGRMEDKSDELFRCEFYKDGSAFFKGFLTLLTPKRDITISKGTLQFKCYDGISRLKEYTDFSSISSDYQPRVEIMRQIMNTLQFDLDLKIYQRFYKSAGIISAEFIRLKDYLAVKPNATFYDVIDMIAKQMNYEVYQSGGYWVFRQLVGCKYVVDPVVANGMKQYIINYSTGAETYTAVSENFELTTADLSADPFAFKYKKYNKVEVRQKCYDPASLPKRSDRQSILTFDNGYFTQGSTGWTISAGSPVFYNGCVKMAPGDEIYQDSSAISAGANLVIAFNTVCTRMVLQQSERLDQSANDLIQVQFRATGGTVYYLTYDTLRWQTSEDAFTDFGIPMYGIDQDGTFIEEYSINTLDKQIEVPAPAEAGVVRIIMKGGGIASGNNYPLECVQHNFASVEAKRTNNHDIVVPSYLMVSAETAADYNRVLKYEIPFSDLDPFNVNYWYGQYDIYDGWTYTRIHEWNTGSEQLPLMELLAKSLLKFHQYNQGLDIDLMPGTLLDYDNIAYGDLDGDGERYYLCVYEEAKLIDDMRNFVMLEHLENAVSTTVKRYYEYNSGGGGTLQGSGNYIQPYASMYTGSAKVSLNKQYIKSHSIHFDYTTTTGVIYRKDPLDVALIRIMINIAEGYQFDNSLATLRFKLNSNVIWESDFIAITASGLQTRDLYAELSDNDEISIEIDAAGSVQGEGIINLQFESKG